MTTYWSEHVQLPGGKVAAARITVMGDRITAVDPVHGAGPDDERLDGLVLPGLANAHSHAFHRALRGRTHGGTGTFWTWRDLMYGVAARLDPDLYLDLARAVYSEMLLAGYTAVGEFHYLHHGPGGAPYADPNAMGLALVQAASEAGIRLTLLDTLYLAGGLGGDGHLPLDEVQQRFSDGDVDAWGERVLALRDVVDGGRLSLTTQVGTAAHSVRGVPAAALTQMGGVRESLPDSAFHVHLSEQPAENAAAVTHYGRTPTGLLADAGLLGESTTVVHATHLTDDDIDLLGDTGTTACFCPTTERDLADGIGPARALLDAGAPISLGSDQHAVLDAFEEVRGLETHERLTSLERGRFSPGELVHAASAAGYRSLAWDGGRLEAGTLADFVVVRLDSVRTTGCRPGQAVYAATAADVDTVVVGGRVVVRDGRHHLGPVAPAMRRALEPLLPHSGGRA